MIKSIIEVCPMKKYVLFLILQVSMATMAQESLVTKTIIPLLNDRPVMYQSDIKGGYHVVDNLMAVNGDIGSSKKENDMIAWDKASGRHYQWDGLSWNALNVIKSWQNGDALAGQIYLYNGNLYRAIADNTISGSTDPTSDALTWQSLGSSGTVIDDVNSLSTTAALSANQGRLMYESVNYISAYIARWPLGSINGQLLYWNDAQWNLLDPPPGAGYQLEMNDGIPQWVGQPPGIPFNITALGGAEQATVFFEAPYNSPFISSYTVTASPGGVQVTVNQAGSGSIVVPLSAGEYTFTVRANNEVGAGNPSVSSNIVTVTDIPKVTTATGRVWMDRNLGASQVATSIDDALAFGDLYQWGRGSDGHQLRTSATTTTQAANDEPGHGNFIKGNAEWQTFTSRYLWQGVNGVNNPCPTGFRIPTYAEWEAEINKLSTKDAIGMFNYSLKLPRAGRRSYSNGSISLSSSAYWSSTISPSGVANVNYFQDGVIYGDDWTADAKAVRCIKD